MNFKTVNIIKHPIQPVWTAMRDALPKLVPFMEDIQSIDMDLHEENSDIHKVVNTWRASPRLPQGIIKTQDPEMFTWTEYAEWNNHTWECQWRIEPHYWKDRISIQGTTKFEPAMGGRGTRIIFSGTIQWQPQNASSISNLLEGMVLNGFESVVNNLIPKNLRKITEALTTYLDNNKP